MVLFARQEHRSMCYEYGLECLPFFHYGWNCGLSGLNRISRWRMVLLPLCYLQSRLVITNSVCCRFFEQMSSIKTRKHYVIFDMAFSGLWSFFFVITFAYMCIAWSKTEDIKFSFASSNIYGAIFFAFLSIFFWVINQCLAKNNE